MCVCVYVYNCKGPFTRAIFAAILEVILVAIQARFRGDFKSPV